MKFYALDIETAPIGDNIPDKQAYALEPWSFGKRSTITSVSIGDGSQVKTITDLSRIPNVLASLKGQTVFAANAVFDVAYLCAAFGYEAIKDINWMDVQVLGKLLENGDDHRLDSYSLANCAMKFAKDWEHLNEFIVMKSEEHKAGENADYWLQRGSWDTEVTWIIAKNLIDALPAPQIKAFKWMSKCIAPLARGLVQGIEVDYSLIDELDKSIKARLKEYLSELGVEASTIASPKKLAALLFTDWGLKPEGASEKTGAPSTSEDNLKLIQFKSNDSRLDILMKYKKLQTIQSKYVKGFKSCKEYLGSNTIHGFPRVFAAVTSRMSYSSKLLSKFQTSIALHQLPNSKDAKLIKKSLICPEGYGMIAFDFSAQELRVAALVTGDPVMTKAFKERLDLHSLLCSSMFGYAYDEVVEANANDTPEHIVKHRKAAKLLNLSCLYRIGHDSLARKFFTSYNERITEGTAKEYLNAYKSNYTGIPRYWVTEVANTRDRGYGETIGGGVRYYTRATDWKKESSCINHKIQGSSAVQTYFVIAKIAEKFPDLIVIVQVHDSLVFYCPIDALEETAKELDRYMNEEIDYSEIWGIEMPFRMTVETKYGLSYGDLGRVK
jgi:DNA polymerase I-like protein with 3'-5' exonuclease and polymerase domains